MPEFDYRKSLSCWFGLTYASWLTMPRVLMEAMPEDWQERMAVLLNEYDDAYPNKPDIGTRVQIVADGKLIKCPPWLLNYRHPDRSEISKMREAQ
jgi:hypothetical protein